MVKMPVAEHHREFLDAFVFKGFPDERCIRNRNMRVINDGFASIHNGIACNAEGKRTIVHPVISFSVTVAVNTTVIKRIYILVGVENAQVCCH